MPSPTVTALLATHRRPGLLPRALASIAGQGRAADEVIVVDDSPDGLPETGDIVARAGLPDARATANRRAPGPGGAWNTAAAMARGEFLAFLDDDDEWLPDHLAGVMALIGRLDADVVCCDTWKRRGRGADAPAKAAPDALTPAAFLTRNPGLHASNLVLRAARLRQVGGFDESLPALIDRDLGLRLALVADLVYAPLHRRSVRRHIHAGPRLSAAGSSVMGAALRRFLELHGHRMTPAERRAHRGNAARLWNLDEHGRALDGDRA